MTKSSLRLALIVLAGLMVGAAAALAIFPEARERLLPASAPSVGRALVGGAFSLTDQTGKRVTDKDFRGRYTLVFFGFTNCPDVCPSALQVMAAALDKLAPRAKRSRHCSSPLTPSGIPRPSLPAT